MQFARGEGSCLTVGGTGRPRERGPLAVGRCDVGGAAWRDGIDALGNPQISSFWAPDLCINDDSVKCDVGNRIFLHQCQGNASAVHTANHFVFEAGKIVAKFCRGPAMCLAASAGGGVALGSCSAASAGGWHRREVDAPAPLPAAPPLPPPPPPLPPPGRRCTDCPNIIFFLTDDQDILLGGALPTSSEFSPGATPLPRTKELMFDAVSCTVFAGIWVGFFQECQQ